MFLACYALNLWSIVSIIGNTLHQYFKIKLEWIPLVRINQLYNYFIKLSSDWSHRTVGNINSCSIVLKKPIYVNSFLTTIPCTTRSEDDSQIQNSCFWTIPLRWMQSRKYYISRWAYRPREVWNLSVDIIMQAHLNAVGFIWAKDYDVSVSLNKSQEFILRPRGNCLHPSPLVLVITNRHNNPPDTKLQLTVRIIIIQPRIIIIILFAFYCPEMEESFCPIWIALGIVFFVSHLEPKSPSDRMFSIHIPFQIPLNASTG